MKITAYPLYDHAALLQPAAPSASRATSGTAAGRVPTARAWVTANETFSPTLTLEQINRQGWTLLCPVAFEATWNGGPNPEDIQIRLTEDATVGGDFVQSQLGAGLLTFYPGYQCKTEAGYLLWVRGPINAPKDGLYPLEQIVDTSLLPCTINVTWKFR